jgi:CHAD domain-containing protein
MDVIAEAVEREVKLSMDRHADLPDLRGVVGGSVRQPEQRLIATYFDTFDRRLWRRGITLRHRTGEGPPRWTMKLPRPTSGDALVRTELEWAGDNERVPQEALNVVSGVVRRAPLEKVAELHTSRIRFRLERDGASWAELADDRVTVVGGRADGRRIRQVELEITSSGPDVAYDAGAVVKALRRAGAHPDPHPKLEKVLGPPEQRRPLGRTSSAEDVVRQAISAGLDRLLDHDFRIRLAHGDLDPEDVHQARVATRRLRSDLQTLKTLLDPVWVRHVRDDLRWVANALGEIRDIDVLRRDLIEARASDRLTERLGDARGPAVEALRQVMTERRYLDLLDRLHAASVRVPAGDGQLAGRKARDVLPELVNRRWKRLRREVRRGGARPRDDQLHQVRKRSKQLRYAAELAIPVIGAAPRRTAKASKALQTLLGEHHDAVVAWQWLSRVDNGEGTPEAFEVSTLLDREDRRRQRLSRTWRSHYEKLAQPRRRAWLEGSG